MHGIADNGANGRGRSSAAAEIAAQVDAKSMQHYSSAETEVAARASRQYEAVQASTARRGSRQARVVLVSGGLSLVVCAVMIANFGESIWGAQRRTWVGLLSENGKSAEEIRTEDEEHCEKFEGFLKTECLEKRRDDRQAPRLWTEEEVRNGLWETEKALADLQVRQYKRSKEREELHEEHEEKMDTFKERITSALDLIHQIQDEMGLRHSQLVTHLELDVNMTTQKLRQYLNDGVEHVDGKVDVLTEREDALTQRLLDMIEVQAQTLEQHAQELHDAEIGSIERVHSFTEGVSHEQQEQDHKLLTAIMLVRNKIEALAAREADHHNQVQTNTSLHNQRQTAQKHELDLHEAQSIDEARRNLTEQLAQDKADIRARMAEGFRQARGRRDEVGEEAERLLSELEQELRVHEATQAANNSEQAALLEGLQADIMTFNITSLRELDRIEGRLGQLEGDMEAAQQQLDAEREARRREVSTAIETAMQEASQGQGAVERKVTSEVAGVGPRAQAVADELAKAIREMEAQRQADLALLKGSLEQGLHSVVSTVDTRRERLSTESSARMEKGFGGLENRTASMEKMVNEADGKLQTRTGAWHEEEEARNEQEDAAMGRVRTEHQAAATARDQELTRLDGEVETLARLIEAAATDLHGSQAIARQEMGDMLASALQELERVVQGALRVQQSTINGQLQGGIRPVNRSIQDLTLQVRSDLDDVQGKLRDERNLRDEMSNGTAALLNQLRAQQQARRQQWAAQLGVLRADEAAIERNITDAAQFWAAERVRVRGELVSELGESLGALQEAILAAQTAVEGRIRAGVSAWETEANGVLRDDGQTEASGVRNLTLRIGGEKRTMDRANAHSRAESSALEDKEQQDEQWALQELARLRRAMAAKESDLSAIQARVERAVRDDDADVREGFHGALTEADGVLSLRVQALNTSEAKDLEEYLRKLTMEVDGLGWRLGAIGQGLRAAVAKEQQKIEEAFLREDDEIRAMNHSRRELVDQQAQQLSALEQRISELARDIQGQFSTLHDAAQSDRDALRADLKPRLAALAAELDAGMRRIRHEFTQELQGKASAAAQGEVQERGVEENALAALRAALNNATSKLDQDETAQWQAVGEANVTVAADDGRALAMVDALNPVLQELQNGVERVFQGLKAAHEAAMAENARAIDEGMLQLRGHASSEVSAEASAINRELSTEFDGLQANEGRLESEIRMYVSRVKDEMTTHEVRQSQRHERVRDQLSDLKNTFRVARSNLTAQVDSLRQHFNEWSTTMAQSLNAQKAAQASGMAEWLRALQTGQNTLQSTLNAIRTTALTRINDLRNKIEVARVSLIRDQQQIRVQQQRDKQVIDGSVATGLATVQRNAQNELRIHSANETSATRADLLRRRAEVAELARRVATMIADMNRRVLSAMQAERVDDTQQQAQINSQRTQLDGWWRQSEQSLYSLEARLQRVQHALDSKREAAHVNQARAVATVVDALQRNLQTLNSTVKSAFGSTSTQVTQLTSGKIAQVDAQLSALRYSLTVAINKKDRDLQTLARQQLAQAESLKRRIERLYRSLQSAREYASNREDFLEQKVHSTENTFRTTHEQYLDRLRQQHDRIRGNTRAQFDVAKRQFAAQVDTQQRSIDNIANSYVVRARSRLTGLLNTLSAGINSLTRSMDAVSRAEQTKQAALRQKIEDESDRRGTVVRLEREVATELETADAAVEAFDHNQTHAHHDTVTDIEAAEGQISLNEGLSQTVSALARTLQSIKLSLQNLERDETNRHQDMNQQMSSAATDVEQAQTTLRDELMRLERLLLNDVNERVHNRATNDANIRALHIRADDANATLHRLKARFSARLGRPIGDFQPPPAAASGPTAAPSAPPAPVSTEPPPPEASLLNPATNQGLLNSYCAKWRDEHGGDHVFYQKKNMAECMAQDCVQSLEHASVGGCRWLDGNGLCYSNHAAQQWCTDNAPNTYCTDAGANAAHSPLGTAGEDDQTQWMPKQDVILSNRGPNDPATFSCSCMKDCTCTASTCYCFSREAVPVGYNDDLSATTVQQNSNKKGECSCSCGGILS